MNYSIKTPSDKLNITLEQRRNLYTLSKHLIGTELRAEFNMSVYCDKEHSSLSSDCGTVGCAVGHGPFAGITKLRDESWNKYAKRCFVDNDSSSLYAFLFGPGWALHDNSPQGAAKRIAFALTHGLPHTNSYCAYNEKGFVPDWEALESQLFSKDNDALHQSKATGEGNG